ncbi:ASB16 protein, partial [Centropus unirufus]|nr:ASB16 protein [Centropus unirufus]
MAQETFAFSPSALRSLQLQRELLEQEERRRALAHRFLPSSLRSPLTPARRPRYCRDPAVHNALYAGDLERVKSIFKDESTANMVMETVSEELVWSPEQGLWGIGVGGSHPAPRGLCGRGDCGSGGPRPAPGGPCGRGSLGVPPPSPRVSRRCAELLLAHGARLELRTRERGLTPLHVAARQGLEAHVELYLSHGADPGSRSRQGETPLNAACAAAERPDDTERYLGVARRLLAAGADPGAAGRKDHTPLHNACGNGQHRLVQLLLCHGADPTVQNCAGFTPMDCAVHAVEEFRLQHPEKIIALLLDHGARPVHPKVGHGDGGAWWVSPLFPSPTVTPFCHQMLKLCCRHPPALEMLLNAYDRVPPADGWVGAVPPELWEEHKEFYASAVAVAGQPRRLQHLARCALRWHLGARCHAAVPTLSLPPALRRYLQLPLQGFIS